MESELKELEAEIKQLQKLETSGNTARDLLIDINKTKKSIEDMGMTFSLPLSVSVLNTLKQQKAPIKALEKKQENLAKRIAKSEDKLSEDSIKRIPAERKQTEIKKRQDELRDLENQIKVLNKQVKSASDASGILETYSQIIDELKDINIKVGSDTESHLKQLKTQHKTNKKRLSQLKKRRDTLLEEIDEVNKSRWVDRHVELKEHKTRGQAKKSQQDKIDDALKKLRKEREQRKRRKDTRTTTQKKTVEAPRVQKRKRLRKMRSKRSYNRRPGSNRPGRPCKINPPCEEGRINPRSKSGCCRTRTALIKPRLRLGMQSLRQIRGESRLVEVVKSHKTGKLVWKIVNPKRGSVYKKRALAKRRSFQQRKSSVSRRRKSV